MIDLGKLVALVIAARNAEDVLKDYIQLLESKGASLNYGHKVMRDLAEALSAFQEHP